MSRWGRRFQRLLKAPHDLRTFGFCPVSLEFDTFRISGGPYIRNETATSAIRTRWFPELNLKFGHPSQERWAIMGPAGSGKTTLLDIIRGRCVSYEKEDRSYPALDELMKLRSVSKDPLSLISYMGTPRRDGKLTGSAGKGAYLSARFESGHEASDLTLQDYLTGNVHLNPGESERRRIHQLSQSVFYGELVKKFRISGLTSQPLSSLSNGQTRRARIAKALALRPGLLLLDEPFIGLDPLTRFEFSQLFEDLSKNASLGIVCALGDSEEVPRFVTHVAFINSNHEVEAAGPRLIVRDALRDKGYFDMAKRIKDRAWTKRSVLKNPDRVQRDWFHQENAAVRQADAGPSPSVIKMSGVQVRYGEKIALGAWQQESNGTQQPGLWWNVHQGERWGIFGPNGAGKTTLLALISSDHPKAYSEPVQVFGRSRLPSAGQPGLSVFDLQSRIGQASPEIHNFFPRHLSVRRTLESAWAETFQASPQIGHEEDERVEATLRWFQSFLNPALSHGDPTAAASSLLSRSPASSIEAYKSIDLDWADSIHFRDLEFSAQRVALFLRAVIRKPDLIILDEAFGGMSMLARITCMTWLTYGETVTVEKRDRHVLKSPSRLVRFDNTRQSRERPPTVTVGGLEPRQTLLCVAHRQEDVPPILNRWLMLPPDGGRADGGATENGIPPSFGEFNFQGDEWVNGPWWKNMWIRGSQTTGN